MPMVSSLPAILPKDAPLNAGTPRSAQPRISCVVPAYNEAANLGPLLEALTTALRALSPQWEVIVVDDGSTDATALAMLTWLQRPGVRYLQLSRNFGKEAALTAGIDHALGEVVVLIDADLQHPPSMIGAMVEAWRGGADMVCTARASRSDESWRKRLGTWLFYRLVNSGSATPIPVDAGDFRLMDRRVVEALKSLPERNRFMKGLYAWVGFSTVVLPYTPAPRHAGKSSFSMRRLSRLAFTGVTAFTNAPLRLWSGLGAAIALISLGFALYIVVVDFIVGHDVPGWATLVTGISFSIGVQLLSVGILGEYIGRIFDEVKQRPVYIIGQALGQGGLVGVAAPLSGQTAGGPAAGGVVAALDAGQPRRAAGGGGA
jgi:glycosyltransferase involved in cell wall biosynthesis